MRFRLRTLLIVLALGPPVLAFIWLVPNPLTEVLLIVALFGLLVVPIWAGVRRAALLKQRRAKRKQPR